MKRGPDRYGPAWDRVKRLPCFLKLILPGHRCGLGVSSGHTAHHVDRLDSKGLLPCCGLVHDWLHGHGSRGSRGFRRARAVARLCLIKLGISLDALAMRYVTGDYPGECDLEF